MGKIRLNQSLVYKGADKSLARSWRKQATATEGFDVHISYSLPVPVAVRSKAYVFGPSPAEIVGSNPTGGMDVCLLWVLYVVR